MKEMQKCGLCGKPLHSSIETFGGIGEVPQCSGCWFGMTEEGESAKLWKEDEENAPPSGYILIPLKKASEFTTWMICPVCKESALAVGPSVWDETTGEPIDIDVFCCSGDEGRVCVGPSPTEEIYQIYVKFARQHRVDTTARQARRAAASA